MAFNRDHSIFENAEKVLKLNRSISQHLQVRLVLNPFTKKFIDSELAVTLGILYNGYYRNQYGGLIPLRGGVYIAAGKGLIQFTVSDETEREEMEIEYYPIEKEDHSQPLMAILIIRSVYDNRENKRMISIKQALAQALIDTDTFSYRLTDTISLPLHTALYQGYILGELRTTMRKYLAINLFFSFRFYRGR
ncbi:unnamed protein product [Didymodactylos carnosus]|uniref:Uncharacterized protein n=1 Tax=Didymodactylos carnosus TaxID=1234261 RepID=A0A8S2WYQ7_9BILA|nr:unnamed protein product [Didymodactylos carnosus]